VTATGYEELVPFGVPLPYSRTETLHTVYDYLRSNTFEIYYRKSILDAPTEIGMLKLTRIRVAKKGVPKVVLTLSLHQDLIGCLTVQDTFTKSRASTTFDGSAAFRAQESVKTVVRTRS